jgi:hypothetical protein
MLKVMDLIQELASATEKKEYEEEARLTFVLNHIFKDFKVEIGKEFWYLWDGPGVVKGYKKPE